MESDTLFSRSSQTGGSYVGTDKNPKRMTDLELQAEHVRLDRQIKKLQNHADQSQSYYEAEGLSKRKLILKEEIDRRKQEREVRKQAEVHISTQVEIADQPDLFMTADGDPYRP